MQNIQDKLNQNKTNLIEQQEKQNKLIEDLKSEIETSRSEISDLRSKLAYFKNNGFPFDKNTKNEIKELKMALNSVFVPEEVKLTKSINFSNITSKVLLVFFFVSIPFMGLTFGYGFYMRKEQVKNGLLHTEYGDFSAEQVEWLYQYLQNMKDKCPQTHTKYLDNNSFPKHKK